MHATPNVSLVTALFLASLLAFPCRSEEKPMPTPVNDPQFHPVLLSVARYYEQYGRVDVLNRWVPESCNIHEGFAHLSRSNDEKSHGGKLYYLYAKNAKEYLQTSE